MRVQAEKQKNDNDLLEKLAKFEAKPDDKEARDKFVSAARVSIAKMSGKDKKLAAYGVLAAQVAKAGDRELAGEIMKSCRAACRSFAEKLPGFPFELDARELLCPGRSG